MTRIFQASRGGCEPGKSLLWTDSLELPSDQKDVPVSTVIWTKDNSAQS